MARAPKRVENVAMFSIAHAIYHHRDTLDPAPFKLLRELMGEEDTLHIWLRVRRKIPLARLNTRWLKSSSDSLHLDYTACSGCLLRVLSRSSSSIISLSGSSISISTTP